METAELIPHIEALIFASDKPLPVLDIIELVNSAFGFMEDKITLDQVEAAIDGIREKYTSEFYPFEVTLSGGGWQFLTKREYHKTIAQLNGEKFMKRLSAAALETLAIVAYKQPVTKGQIEAIRGVSADYAIQKLLEKELIVISGRNEQLPGHPLVYVTSKSFMDYFGINSADELPKIKEVLSEQLVEPTVVGEEETEGDGNPLAVSENGELVEDAIPERFSETAETEVELEAELEAEAEPKTEEENRDHPNDETDFTDEKKQVTEEVPGSEALDEEQNEEDEEQKDDEETSY